MHGTKRIHLCTRTDSITDHKVDLPDVVGRASGDVSLFQLASFIRALWRVANSLSFCRSAAASSLSHDHNLLALGCHLCIITL